MSRGAVWMVLVLMSGCDGSGGYRCEVDAQGGSVAGVVRPVSMTRGLPVTIEQGGTSWEVKADSDGRFEAEVDDGPVVVSVGDELGNVDWRREDEEPQERTYCSEVRAESCDAGNMVFVAESCEHLE